MPYPTLSEYKEAILLAEDNFNVLTNLRPVLDEEGQPVMTSGNFAVVFKMKNVKTGGLCAVKCFTREQEGRAEAYRLIAEELKDVDSPYLTSIRYLDKELFVDTNQSTETEFPVLLMDWVEGKTLDKYLRENLDDKYALEMLAYRFSLLAQWLIPQPFAHGDLKPDNILVKDDGSIVLVDYDGMYVPAMKDQKARELGSPDYRHPLRTENDFDEHIDDFPLVSIFLSLKAIALNPQLLEEYGIADRLLFSENDYRDIASSRIIRRVTEQIANVELTRIYATFIILISEKRLTHDSYKLVFHKKEHSDLFKSLEKQSPFDKESKYCMSCLLLNGLECEQDRDKGIYLLTELAEKGDAKAQFRLGRCFQLGLGVSKNQGNAITWYTKAAEQGYPKAQYNLAYYFEKGLGVSQSYEKAFEWFAKAAEQGLAHAQYKLGVYFIKGQGVQQNCEKAVEWFAKAARKGYEVAQYNLAICYEKGLGIQKNYNKAIEWYVKAADEGFVNAQRRLKQVTSEDLANGIADEFGIIYSADRTRLLKTSDSFKVDQYIIFDKVQIICNGAFRYCKSIGIISIPNSVKIIGEQAFWGCENITSITIPSSVINIGDDVFYECKNLKHIIIDAGNPNYDSRDNCNAIINSRSNTLIVGCHNSHIPNGVTNIEKSAFSSVSNLFNITIPKSLINIPDEVFYLCNGLTGVTIQNGVKTIGAMAFSGCLNLTNIVIPDSVTAIGERAFDGCDKLKSITIPRSVKTIGKGAFAGIEMDDGVFYGCNNLERIIVDIDNPQYDSRNNCNAIIETRSNTLIVGCQNTIIPNDIASIDTLAFRGCQKLTSIVIPGSIAIIPDFVFAFCRGLTTVTLHSGIMAIGKMAFYGCENISSIIFPDTITSIDERAFAGCDKLKAITIPHSISYIGEEAFAGMDSLNNYQGHFNERNNIESIKVDEGNASYDSRNNCNAIIETQGNTLIAGCKNTIIPNGVKSIGRSAFAYCEELTAIEIPDGVTEIMDYAFYQCKSLKKVVLPNSITKIGKNAFGAEANCGSWGIEVIPTICIQKESNSKFKELLADSKGYLYEENLSTYVTEKDREIAWVDEFGGIYSAFKKRLLKAPDNIQDYTIREGTEVICAWAFNHYRDNSISSINIPNTITTIGEYAFSSCKNLKSITIPKSVTSIEKGAFSGCVGLERIVVESGNPIHDSRDNCNAIIETQSNTLIVGCKKTVISLGISGIGDSAFSCCKELKSIIIPEGVTHIGKYAFNGCDELTCITIPSSVVIIGEGAFGACKNLKEITLHDGMTSIGKEAFEYCENLSCITIPQSVTSIGDRVFVGCKSLTNIFVPKGSRNDFGKQLPEYKDIIVEC